MSTETASCVLRPVREDDLGAVVALAGSLGGTLTTLPHDAGNLAARIESSLRSFDHRVRSPGAEYYLFVLEDTRSGRVIGTSALMGRVGGFEPFYTYEIRTEQHAHPPLGISRGMDVLHLKREHRGPSEIGGLALDPGRRESGLGRLLSLGRFLFVHAHPQRFAERMVAEIRGFADHTGRSPFWEAVGRHFFDCELAEADLLSGLGDKEFIEGLVPKHPLYMALLPHDARAAVGQVHPDAEPARTLLFHEGFVFANEVDIFDAGPVLVARTAAIRTVRTARRLRVADIVDGTPPGESQLVGSTEGGSRVDFRACVTTVAPRGADGVAIGGEAAHLMRVREGDEVVCAQLRGRPA